MDSTQKLNGSPYSAHNSLKPVNFYCAAPKARRVEITGDFNHWHPLPMQRLLDGWWFKRLDLSHGHHLYRFIVDGKPELDPKAAGAADDENNELASLVAVS
ncbi:MAG TPA: glycoside hydrolase family 13 [Verrucomicrobiae bacterium]|nr:glycoside hydrolase family 13 [Verrucomicrobiae bacterium]